MELREVKINICFQTTKLNSAFSVYKNSEAEADFEDLTLCEARDEEDYFE